MTMIKPQPAAPDLLRTKQHFEILDGLRGIAALAIVVFHFMEIVIADYTQNFIAHGFLAVDFFFCLSGFVIGYAYDDRMAKMGIREFFKSRFIRLHPLVILGTVLGLAGYFLDPFASQPPGATPFELIVLTLTSLLLIPFPIMASRYFNLFSFNAPAWSLFWEYIANIAYALVLHKISRRLLTILTLLAAIVLWIVCYRAGNLLGGWSYDTFWDGCARISFSFLAGLLVFRTGWIMNTKIGFITLSILLSLAFIMPYSKWNWLTEPLVVVFYFPLLIYLGAGATLQPWLRKLCVFFGKISYPLYMTHYAAMWIFASYNTSHKPGPAQLALVISIGTLVLVGFAWLMMKLYDTPVRQYLTARRKR
jgi:peptidoglycan/LPS O-acetylase OafA/YrhL